MARAYSIKAEKIGKYSLELIIAENTVSMYYTTPPHDSKMLQLYSAGRDNSSSLRLEASSAVVCVVGYGCHTQQFVALAHQAAAVTSSTTKA